MAEKLSKTYPVGYKSTNTDNVIGVYADMLAKARKNKTLTKIESQIILLKTKGEFICGRLIGTKPIPTKNGVEPATGYIFDTDKGTQILLTGAYAGTILNDSNMIGKVLLVTRGDAIKDSPTQNHIEYEVLEVK